MIPFKVIKASVLCSLKMETFYQCILSFLQGAQLQIFWQDLRIWQNPFAFNTVTQRLYHFWPSGEVLELRIWQEWLIRTIIDEWMVLVHCLFNGSSHYGKWCGDTSKIKHRITIWLRNYTSGFIPKINERRDLKIY